MPAASPSYLTAICRPPPSSVDPNHQRPFLFFVRSETFHRPCTSPSQAVPPTPPISSDPAEVPQLCAVPKDDALFPSPSTNRQQSKAAASKPSRRSSCKIWPPLLVLPPDRLLQICRSRVVAEEFVGAPSLAHLCHPSCTSLPDLHSSPLVLFLHLHPTKSQPPC